ncbi:ATP-binding protein [Chondromyces apiculatus]|nr:helicase HerA-like domain-containing protein [Chondromyces apiculatus]
MSAAVPTSAPGPAAPSDAQAPRVLLLGKTEGITPQELTMPSDALNKHAAFLGGTGSGKTTLALGLVEQLLLQSVPVVLVDRKGDLCRYLHEKAWSEPLGDPAREQVRRRLRERVVPALYTPGGTAGRPLGITLMPTGIQDLPPDDRDEEATHAAGALGDMLGYKHHGRDQSCRAILVQALRLLASSGVPGSLEALVRFIDDQDPALVSAIGRLDTKLFTKLVQDLETFKLTNVRLLAGEGEQLDIDALLGLDGNLGPGRTRLCVVSTKFLGDSGKVLFWVAQLLIQLGRWASRRPSRSGALQAAILFDEADMYLPAVGQPATKAPMENLLRRARSAGLGLLLATQSPGDFDYRCRDNINTWMLGRITQPVAIQKMRPMLEDSRVDVAGKLAGRQVGQFFLLRNGDVSGFTSRLPAILPAQLPEEEILALARASRR